MNETVTVLDVENAKMPETKVNAAVTVSASINKVIVKHRYTKWVVCAHSSWLYSSLDKAVFFEQQTSLPVPFSTR